MRTLLVGLLVFIVTMGCATTDSNTIIFAGSGGYPPFNFIDENNEVVGFDVDVGREIATRLGMQMKYTTTAWDGIIEGLRAGRYDAILGSMAVTEKRQEVVDFSVPYYFSGAQLFVKEGGEVESPEDITDAHSIGVATGTTFEQDAKKLGAQVKLYEDDNQTLIELLNGRLDGVITDRVVGLNAIDKMDRGGEITPAGTLLRKEECAIALRQDSDKLRTKIDSVLTLMHKDGTLRKISHRWFDGVDITVQ